MGFAKWLMKQQWRIVQVRGIWSLFYGILLLAASYYMYVPIIRHMGDWGPFVFAGGLLVVFAVLGYLYDRVFILWAPANVVTQERNPYQYVARPIDRIFWFPVYSALLDSCQQLVEHFGLDPVSVDETREYYAKFQTLGPETRQNIDEALQMREKYVQEHPFSKLLED